MITLEAIIKVIKELISKEFYGELTIKFNKGQIVHLVKQESIKELSN